MQRRHKLSANQNQEKNVDPRIVAGGETLYPVDDFVYLGSNLSSKADLGREIDRRL